MFRKLKSRVMTCSATIRKDIGFNMLMLLFTPFGQVAMILFQVLTCFVFCVVSLFLYTIHIFQKKPLINQSRACVLDDHCMLYFHI